MDVSAVQVATSADETDRKSTRLNSSHPSISYAVFCLKKKLADIDDFCALIAHDIAARLMRDEREFGFVIEYFHTSLGRKLPDARRLNQKGQSDGCDDDRHGQPGDNTRDARAARHDFCVGRRVHQRLRIRRDEGRGDVFFFRYPATPEIYTLSLHDALPI